MTRAEHNVHMSGDGGDNPFEHVRVLAGKYRLGRLIGEGGMGSVYEAEHIGLGSRVAVKLLADRSLSDIKSQMRFRREARAAAAVRHPNVVTVTDTGTDEAGVPFIIMELLEGETLASALRRQRVLKPTVAAAIASQVLAGLQAAHEKGVVHRDLKPGNIFLVRQPDGTRRIKLLDFGISKFAGARNFDVTEGDALLGTPHFMAPEQLQRGAVLDHRVDVYAVGVLMYRMVTGQMPYTLQGSRSILEQIIGQQCTTPSALRPELSPEIESAIARAMAPNPEERFATAADFRQALHAAEPRLSPTGTLLGRISSVDGPSSAEPSSSQVMEKRQLLGIFLALVFLIAAGLTALVLARKTEQSESQQAYLGSALRLGVSRFLPPHLVDEKLTPVTDYLGGELGRPVKLVVLEDYLDVAEHLQRGDVNLAALSAYSYIKAKRETPALKLLATPVTRELGPNYIGYILTRADSDVYRLADLKGRVFCYVNPSSTSGYLYPRALLREAGLDPDEAFRATRFTGDHLSSLRALHSEACDGAAVYQSILGSAGSGGINPDEFRLLASTPEIPFDAYVASPSVDAQTQAKLRTALIRLRKGSALARRVLGRESYVVGFTRVDDSHYDPVRRVERFLSEGDSSKTVEGDGLPPLEAADDAER